MKPNLKRNLIILILCGGSFWAMIPAAITAIGAQLWGVFLFGFVWLLVAIPVVILTFHETMLWYGGKSEKDSASKSSDKFAWYNNAEPDRNGEDDQKDYIVCEYANGSRCRIEGRRDEGGA